MIECDWHNGKWISKDQYETRLKTDIVAMLKEIDIEFDEQYHINRHELHDDSLNRGLEQGQEIIQQKINELRAEIEPQVSEYTNS